MRANSLSHGSTWGVIECAVAGISRLPGESLRPMVAEEEPMTAEEQPSAAGGDDPRAMLRRALGQGARLISDVGPAQAALPTPCEDWTLGQLVEHLVGALRFHGGITAGTIAGAQLPTRGSLPPLGDDWAGAYGQAQGALLAAWQRPGALEASYQLPFATLPGPAYAQFITLEVAAHSWDLASATGRRDTLDDAIGADALEIAQRVLPRDERPPQVPFKAVVEVPANAPVYDRLAAYLGRRP